VSDRFVREQSGRNVQVPTVVDWDQLRRENPRRTEGIDQAERLARVRQEYRLSQGELAGAIGVNVSTVSVWENGHRIPKGLYLIRLKHILDKVEAAGRDARGGRVATVIVPALEQLGIDDAEDHLMDQIEEMAS
jgi:DNA-binding transcriptional regulator YiaG